MTYKDDMRKLIAIVKQQSFDNTIDNTLDDLVILTTAVKDLSNRLQTRIDKKLNMPKQKAKNIRSKKIDITKNEWLISPTFDLSSGTFYLNVDAAATEFASTAAANFGADDIVILLASTDNGVSWEELYEWNATTDPGPTGTGLSEITLENYTATSKFAFYGNATSSSLSEDVDFFVDNFRITSTSLGVEDNSISLFNYFPNPVNDVLTIKAQKDVDNITVYNMLGQVVKQQTPNTRDCTVDLSAMQSGAYFVQVSIDNSVETVRILKN